MKRIAQISIVLLALMVVSCHKEVLRPECGNETPNRQMYRSGTFMDSGEQDSDDLTSEGDITDPNSDKDESIRKKR